MHEQSGHFVLQEATRISKSIIWEAQKQFYVQHAIKIWRERPAYFAAQSFIADGLAEFCAAYVLESMNPKEPVTFIELGTGSGCFSYRFVQSLTKYLKAQTRKRIRFRYVMTDIIPDILSVWSQTPMLDALHQQDLVDFAVFDPAFDKEISSESDPLNGANPPIFIANSLFDTIAIDGFETSNNVLLEVLVDTISLGTADPVSALINDELRLEKRKAIPVQLPHYGCTARDLVLSSFATKTNFSIPIGAMDIVDNLLKIAPNGFALLACSKGFTARSCTESMNFLNYRDFSFPLNFDAIRQYCELNGAQTFLQPEARVKQMVLLSLFGSAKLTKASQTQSALDTLRTTLELHKLSANAYPTALQQSECGCTRNLLELLQKFKFDPGVFAVYLNQNFDLIETELSSLTQDDQAELITALSEVDSQLYSFGAGLSPERTQSSDPLAHLINVWQRAQSAQSMKPARLSFTNHPF